MLVKCFAIIYDAVPASNQHMVSVSSCRWLLVKTRCLANAVLLLSQGREKWDSIKLALGERLLC